MRNGRGWRRCCRPSRRRPAAGAAGRTRTTGWWSRACSGSCGRGRRGGTFPRTTARTRRWRTGSTAGGAPASWSGCSPRCSPTGTRGAHWTGCCTTWTGRSFGRTSTRRGRPKGATLQDAQAREALGRSRGGLTTKLHVRAEGGGKPVAFVVSPGQRHECRYAAALLDQGAVKRPGRGRPRLRPERVAGDKTSFVNPGLRQPGDNSAGERARRSTDECSAGDERSPASGGRGRGMRPGASYRGCAAGRRRRGPSPTWRSSRRPTGAGRGAGADCRRTE